MSIKSQNIKIDYLKFHSFINSTSFFSFSQKKKPKVLIFDILKYKWVVIMSF